MEQERAEDRKFQRILDDAALLAMRSDILAALWAFVREWNLAGRPKPSRAHSSFPRWAEIIGGIVEFAGFGCPLETLFERLLAGEAELKPGNKSAFGKLLKRYDRRVFRDGKRFVVDGKGHSRRFMALT
jgi:hypothetical protein